MGLVSHDAVRDEPSGPHGLEELPALSVAHRLEMGTIGGLIVWRIAALAALAVPLCACQATVRVGVSTKVNGSGDLSVALILDKQAAGFVGNPAAVGSTPSLTTS